MHSHKRTLAPRRLICAPMHLQSQNSGLNGSHLHQCLLRHSNQVLYKSNVHKYTSMTQITTYNVGMCIHAHPMLVNTSKEHLVCKLKKSLYGFKQSPRAWYQHIDMFFFHEGFFRSQANHSLYVKQTGEYLLIVIIYVDDVIILASNVTILKWLKSRLEDEFEMNDLGELHYCLGVEFKKDRANRTITMSQSKYIEEVLKRFNMEDW